MQQTVNIDKIHIEPIRQWVESLPESSYELVHPERGGSQEVQERSWELNIEGQFGEEYSFEGSHEEYFGFIVPEQHILSGCAFEQEPAPEGSYHGWDYIDPGMVSVDGNSLTFGVLGWGVMEVTLTYEEGKFTTAARMVNPEKWDKTDAELAWNLRGSKIGDPRS